MSIWTRRLERLKRNITKVATVIADITLILDVIHLTTGKDLKNGSSNSATDAAPTE